jgi:hypothetical protein
MQHSAFADSKSRVAIEQEQMQGGATRNRKRLHKGGKKKMLRR